MSASNWATCPKCAAVHRARLDKVMAELGQAYGTVPVEEFDKLRAAADAKLKEHLPETFREDYEVYGADQGELRIYYSGCCDTCGLEHNYEHKASFYPEDPS